MPYPQTVPDVQVFVRDLQTGTTERVSVAWNAAPASNHCKEGRVSSGGRYVTYSTKAPNIVPGPDPNPGYDVVRDDRCDSGASLTATNLVAGSTATISIAGASGGGLLVLAYSSSSYGQGAFGSPFGVLDLSPPLQAISFVAGPTGDLTIQAPLPPAMSGFKLCMQAVDLTSGLQSDLFARGVL